MNRQLSEKIAVITGGSRGIGAAIAGKLASLGATAVICGRDRSRLGQTAEQISGEGARCETMICDVRSWTSVATLAARIEQTFGQIDILVNCAGVGGFRGALHTMPTETWDLIFETNLRGAFYTMRAFVPMMISAGGGHIVNISSLAGKNPLPDAAAYGASKWGLNGLSYSVAEELRRHGIRVSVVCPGSSNTNFSPHTGQDPSKMLQADDVASVVAMVVTQAPQSFVSEVLMRPTQKP